MLPFGRLWYGDANAVANAIGYALHRSRSHDAGIRVCDDAGNVIETSEAIGRFSGAVKNFLGLNPSLFVENFPDKTQGLGCDLLRIALALISTRFLYEQGSI